MNNFDMNTISVNDVLHTLRECDRNERYEGMFEHMLTFASELTGISVDALMEQMYPGIEAEKSSSKEAMFLLSNHQYLHIQCTEYSGVWDYSFYDSVSFKVLKTDYVDIPGNIIDDAFKATLHDILAPDAKSMSYLSETDMQSVLNSIAEVYSQPVSSHYVEISKNSKDMKEFLKDAAAIEYKGIIFDDFIVGADNVVWAEICEGCVNKYMDLILNELDDAGAIGICSVLGCEESGLETEYEHHYYIDFIPELIHPLSKEQLLELKSNPPEKKDSLEDQIHSASVRTSPSVSSLQKDDMKTL